MRRLLDEISHLLESRGFDCSRQIRHGFDVLCTKTPDGKHPRVILPLEITASTPEEAARNSENALDSVMMISHTEGYPLIITRDRWERQRKMTEARLFAHLETFSQTYARNCEVRRIEKTEAQSFLKENHSYGDAACRYRYGLFLKRHTGHNSEREDEIGQLIAVATFSNARKWIKEGKEIRSYEWTRYASLPGMRVSGGMGKLLKAFIKEVQPDDIMSYADLEWSEGTVYRTLGFSPEGIKDPVTFAVGTETWERFPIRPGTAVHEGIAGLTGALFYRNFGSRKYRLKLTDYK